MPMRADPYRPVQELLHGKAVSDPYRWLEDRSDPKTEEWIQEQSVRCDAYFEDLREFEFLRTRVQRFLDMPVVDQPARVGSLYFFRRRNAGQEQACIYVRDAEANTERVLVDPSKGGRFTSVEIHQISDDANLLAYEVKHSGGDTKEIRVVDVTTGRTLPVSIESGYGRGFAFAPANRGFYCSHESPSLEEDLSIHFHSLVDPPQSKPVFARKRTPRGRLILLADSGRLGALWIHERATELVCDLWISPISHADDWRAVFLDQPLPYSPILHQGRIFVLSFRAAPNGALIELGPDGQQIRTVVPEGNTRPMQIAVINEKIFVCYWESMRSFIGGWTLDGASLGETESSWGTVLLLPQRALKDQTLFFSQESFGASADIYELEPETCVSSLWWSNSTAVPREEFQSTQLSFQAMDGVAVPITLVSSRKLVQHQTRPVLMTSYGGFGVPMVPRFSVLVAIMLEVGAVFAMPHIRGGGDFGRSWHEAARGKNKQNAFYDFIAAGEWLCTTGITSSNQIAIFGGSNAGLLVGVALTRKPELYRAVLAISPLLDMVRYEAFDQAAKWRQEYGSIENREEFEVLHGYSPYHNVSAGVDYPSTLFVAGDRDDRCNPAHVRKMAALLQGSVSQRNPILVDYSAERGHSPCLPLSVRIDALTRRLAFLVHELGIRLPSEAQHETLTP